MSQTIGEKTRYHMHSSKKPSKKSITSVRRWVFDSFCASKNKCKSSLMFI